MVSEQEDCLTTGEFVDRIVGITIGSVVLKEIFRGSRPFKLYFWCFRHIDYWERYTERNLTKSMKGHVDQHNRIMIPGFKLIKRPRKPK